MVNKLLFILKGGHYGVGEGVGVVGGECGRGRAKVINEVLQDDQEFLGLKRGFKLVKFIHRVKKAYTSLQEGFNFL